jgi:hypothetical protein
MITSSQRALPPSPLWLPFQNSSLLFEEYPANLVGIQYIFD